MKLKEKKNSNGEIVTKKIQEEGGKGGTTLGLGRQWPPLKF